MDGGSSPDQGSIQESDIGSAKMQIPEQPVTLETQTPAIPQAATESSEAGKIDISADEVAKTTAERALAYRDLIPKLAEYSISLNPLTMRNKANTGPHEAPISILIEPAGADSSMRYIAVTESGAKVIELPGGIIDRIDRHALDSYESGYYRSTANRSTELRIANADGIRTISMFEVRDASAEEAMQALGRSIQRATSTLPQSMPTDPDQQSTTSSESQGQGFLSRFKSRHTIPDPTDRTPDDRYMRELWNTSMQLGQARSRYSQDVDPRPSALSFEEAVKQDEKMRTTPNIVARDTELNRVDTATRMTEFLKQPLADAYVVTPAPTLETA